MKISAIGLSMGLAFGVAGAAASNISVTVEHVGPSGGFSFTPVWFGVHNGSFDAFDVGSAGGMEITAIAEGGDTGPITAAFAGSGMDTTLVSNTGAPVFSAGESESTMINVGDATMNRYFSFASMLVPSNDLFFGNDNAMAYELFDAAGNFNGPVEIEIYGRNVYDNGSEVNNALGDAAFSTNGGTRTAENGVITRFFDDPNSGGYLASFLGSQTADGNTINAVFDENTLLARITVVPAPGATAGLLLGGLLVSRRRR